MEFTTIDSLVAASSSMTCQSALPRPSKAPELDTSIADLFGGDLRFIRNDWVSAPGEKYTLAVICEDGEYVWCVPFLHDGAIVNVPRKHPKRALLPIGYGVLWPKSS